jgi:hypothetical protein
VIDAIVVPCCQRLASRGRPRPRCIRTPPWQVGDNLRTE